MKYVFLIFSLFISANIYSQYTISGVVKDENNQKIDNAIILIKNSQTNEVVAYKNTDEKGSFEISIPEKNHYTIECNLWGYESEIKEITITDSIKSYPIDFSLKQKMKEIEEVVVLGESAAIKEKKDTLSYNLKSFTNGSERNLKDILNKLPGIEIDENGKIKANGKPVDKLLVDGKEFFGDNHQIATENLTAEMIGGVDVYNHYTNNSNIKEIEGSEKTALNIDIKDEYKGRITGNLSAFSGYENRHKIAANLFRFDRKLNLSFIGNVNNINDEVISLMDYFNMNKTIKNDMSNGKVSDFSVSDDVPSSLVSNDNVIKKQTGFGALNFSYYPTSKLKIEGFSIFNNNFQKERIFNSNRFFQNNNSVTTSDDINSKGNFLFSQTKINAEYKVNDNNIFNYSVSFEPNKDNQEKTIDQTLSSSLNSMSETQNTNKTKFGHQLSFTNRISANKLLTFNVFQEISSEKSDYNLSSDLSNFNLGNYLSQTKKYNNNEWGVLGKFAVKASKNIFTFGGGYSLLNQEFKSNLNTSATPFQNNNSVNRGNFHIENSILKRKGFWQYSLENELVYFDNSLKNEERLYYLPKVQLKLEFKSTSNLTFNYQRQLEFPNANQVFQNAIIQNYYTLRDDNFLTNKPILSNNFGLNYLYIDLFSGTIIYANLIYKHSKNVITSNSSFYQNFSTINNQYADERKDLNSNISFERKLKFLKSRLKANISYSKIDGINFLNNIENKYESNIYFMRLTLVSKFKNPVFNYNLGYELQYNETKYSINNASLNNKIHKPFVNFEGNLSKTIFYHLNNSLFIYKSQNLERNFLKTDFELSLKPQKSKWEYYLKGDDIFNIKKTQIIENNFENNVEQTQIRYRLPGYFGVGVKYNL